MYHHYYQPAYANIVSNHNTTNNPNLYNPQDEYSSQPFNQHHHQQHPHHQFIYPTPPNSSHSDYIPILPVQPMATDNQVALTRTRQSSVVPAPSAQLNKSARQVVPAFLQKLYEMVNDPSNADLIRWSDAGDSFFVLDHERFAREVLGRWFKHQNFSSFVRQLNMYGFHKIPHLQQGVLRSDSDTEFWNFEHPNFHRGQPDLLCLIQRKKQATQSIGDQEGATIVHSATPASTGAPDSSPHPAPQTTTPSNSQIIDVHAIVNGIAAIKRHQTTISEELNELKRSNQLLWQDALAARQRHQKHQDTINRILKFLAGVFGNGANANGATGGVVVGKDGAGRGSSSRADDARAVYPRKNQRLMIEEAPKKDGKGRLPVVQIEEEDEDEADSPTFVRDTSPMSVVATSSPYNAPLSPAASEAPSYINLAAQLSSPASPMPLSRDASVPPSQAFPQIIQPQPMSVPVSNAVATMTPQTAPSTTNSHPVVTPAEQEQMMQVFQQVLSSPGQMQRLLAALSAHNLGDSLQPPFNGGAQNGGSLQHLSPYGTYAQGVPAAAPTAPANGHYTPQGQLSLLTPSPPPLDPLPAYAGKMPSPANGVAINGSNGAAFGPPPQQLVDNSNTLDSAWRVSQDIDKDVDALHSSISSLIETFGLDPSLMEPDGGGQAGARAAAPAELASYANNNNGNGNATTSHVGVGGGNVPPPPPIAPELPNAADESVPDFDFDAFLNECGTAANGFGDGGDGGSANGHVPSSATGDYEMQSTSFMDNVPSPSTNSVMSAGGVESPILALRHEFASTDGSGGVGTGAGVGTGVGVGTLGAPRVKGRKRKSDAAEIEDIQRKNAAGVGSTVASSPGGGTIKARRKR